MSTGVQDAWESFSRAVFSLREHAQVDDPLEADTARDELEV